MSISRPTALVLAVLSFVSPADAQQRDAYGVVKKSSSEVIHDQTLKQGLDQRREYDRNRSQPGSRASGSADASALTCVDALETRSVCYELRQIAKGASSGASVAGLVRRGNPFGRCAATGEDFASRLTVWGAACSLGEQDLSVLRGDSGKRKPEPRPPSTVRPSAPARRPAAPPAAAASASSSSAAPPLLTPELLEERRAKWKAGVKAAEDAIAAEDAAALKELDEFVRDSARVRAAMQDRLESPDEPRRRCVEGKVEYCRLAKQLARTRDEYFGVMIAACNHANVQCAELEKAARASRVWGVHRRRVEARCDKDKDMDACALLAKYHLGSPSWRAAWAWSAADASKEEGRTLALRSCAGGSPQGTDSACAELARAAAEGVGGPRGATKAEQDALDKACSDGRLGPEHCPTPR